MPPTLLTAAWIAPMDGPVRPDAGVVFDGGTILAVGPADRLRRDYPAAVVVDAGNVVLLPGLVNAHVHLELSHLTPGDRPSRFVDWLGKVMSTAGAVDPATSARMGVDQCLKFGVTSVGDITSHPAATRAVLAASGIGGVSYGEVRAMAQRRGFLEERIAAAISPMAGGRVRPGISPHAPYSIEFDGYRRCLHEAVSHDLPLATHLAETVDETEFLNAHTGPFRTLWDEMGAWDEMVTRMSGGSIRVARHLGLLDYPTLLAHVNFCNNDELEVLARGRASVVYCPRTHDFFGHIPHRWREMLDRGINVAVGTDSCASSPDLNLVDDLRLVHRIAPDVDPFVVWGMATTRAALAIGSNAGVIAPGRPADFVSFPVTGGDPLREILETDRLPGGLWLGGASIPPK